MKNDVKNRRRLKFKLGSLMLAVVFTITAGSVGAWYQSKSIVTNTFNAGSLKTTITENFTPPENWFPGVTTDKVVQITNTGTLDAYTRVELQPTLVFYTKTGDKISIADLNTNTDTDTDTNTNTNTNTHYATVNKSAVDNIAERGGYKLITMDSLIEDYSALKGKLTIPDGVTLYATVSKESTTDDDGGTTTRYSYSFVGYYEADSKYYEINVSENVSENVDKYDIMLYVTQKNEYDYSTENGKEVIDKAITLCFDNNDKWVKTKEGAMYFYYKDKLLSGTTTAPLLNAVKLNDDFVYDIYEASFDLNVVNLSSQAYKEAAQAVFGESDKDFNVDILND